MELKIYRYTYNNILAMTVQARYDLVLNGKAITSTEATLKGAEVTLKGAMISQFDEKVIDYFLRLIEERPRTLQTLLRTCHEYIEPQVPFFQNIEVIYRENLSNTFWKELEISKRLKDIEGDFHE